MASEVEVEVEVEVEARAPEDILFQVSI